MLPRKWRGGGVGVLAQLVRTVNTTPVGTMKVTVTIGTTIIQVAKQLL